METKMRVHQDVADQLQLLWAELHDFHQNTLPITALIKAELTIMESATTFLQLKDVFTAMDLIQEELFEIGPLHALSDAEMIKNLVLKVQDDIFDAFRLEITKKCREALGRGGRPFTWAELKLMFKDYLDSSKAKIGTMAVAGSAVAASAESECLTNMKGVCDKIMEQYNTIINGSNGSSKVRFGDSGKSRSRSRSASPGGGNFDRKQRSSSPGQGSQSGYSSRNQQQQPWQQPQQSWQQPQQQPWQQPQQAWQQQTYPQQAWQQQSYPKKQRGQFQQQQWGQPQQQSQWYQPQQQSQWGQSQSRGRGGWNPQSGPFRANGAEAEANSAEGEGYPWQW
jgi:hypothetical protein